MPNLFFGVNIYLSLILDKILSGILLLGWFDSENANVQLLRHLFDNIDNVIPLAYNGDKEHNDDEFLDVDMVIENLWGGQT